MANKRWTCTKCDRPGVLAPGRMRRDDIRRYCIPCSEETGRLVERACPALETKRQRNAEARRERHKAIRAREAAEAKAAYSLADGTDLRPMVRKAQGLKAWARQSDRAARAVARVKVDLVVGNSNGSHGRAWGSHRAHIHINKNEHPGVAMGLIVHELAHTADYAERRGKGGHDRFFWTLWLDAMQEVYPALREREAELWANRDRYAEERRAIAREVSDDKWRWNPQNHYALEWGNQALLREVHNAR